ncbi:hypothetical protein KIPB_015286, partial [Kipferlia bialata]|eukprot:g15286.t1
MERLGGEREAAVQERDTAVQERDTLSVERDHLTRSLEALGAEWNELMQQLSSAVSLGQEGAEEREERERERERERCAWKAERDALTAQVEREREELERVRADRDTLIGERDASNTMLSECQDRVSSQTRLCKALQDASMDTARGIEIIVQAERERHRALEAEREAERERERQANLHALTVCGQQR